MANKTYYCELFLLIQTSKSQIACQSFGAVNGHVGPTKWMGEIGPFSADAISASGVQFEVGMLDTAFFFLGFPRGAELTSRLCWPLSFIYRVWRGSRYLFPVTRAWDDFTDESGSSSLAWSCSQNVEVQNFVLKPTWWRWFQLLIKDFIHFKKIYIYISYSQE